MKFTVLILSLGQLAAQDLQVSGATATQAVVTYSAPTEKGCGVALSESATFTPVVNDVNGTLFTWADTDIGAVTGSLTAGTRVLVLGKRAAQFSGNTSYSRALRADTTHYLRITCEGQVQVAQFSTARISGLVPPDLTFQTAGHGNWAAPDFDWSDVRM